MTNVAIKHFHTRPTEKKKKSWKSKLLLFLILLCTGSFIYIANLFEYQIKGVDVKGAVLTDSSKIKDIVNADISGKYFFLIPKSFVWLYPKSQIENQIKQILSVLNVDVAVVGNNNLEISLTERAQKYLWCPSPTDKVKCFYTDDYGLIFTPAPVLEGNVFVTFSGLVQGEAIGQRFLPQDQMASLLSFISALKDLGFGAKEVNALSVSEIRIVLQSGTEIIVSLEKPLDTVISNLKILTASPDFQNASGGIGKLKYIDLRYGTKAFWK